MDENFNRYWEEAAQIHGHKCPSLFYGVSLGLKAKEAATESTESIVLEGCSKCIRDGAKTVLQDSKLHDKLSIITDSSKCAITIKGNDSHRRFIIAPAVRQHINKLNKELPLEEFQNKGVEYLTNLADDEFISEQVK